LLGVALLLAGAAIPWLSGEFMPTFKEGHFVAQVASRVPGTSLSEMTGIGERVSADLLKLPYVATVEQQVGRAEQGEDTWGPERCEFHIELKRDSSIDQEKAQQEIRDVLEKYPAVQSDVLTFLGDRISESLSGETAQGVVQVFGPDLDVIERASAQIEQRIATVPGIVDVQRSHTGTGANLSVNLLPQRLAQYGLRTAEVLDAIQTAFAGTVVNQVYEKDHPVDVVVLLPPSARASPEALRSLPLRSASGPFITLDDVAQIYIATGRAAIRHQAGQRFASVTFNAGSRGIDGVAADVRRIAEAQVKLPAGTWMEFGGEAAAQKAARRDLILYSLVALSLIVMLLAAAFERRRLAGFVMLNLPFSLIGGVLALAVTGQSLSLGALVGLVTVFGISARNAILLLTHLEHLVDREGGAFEPALITRAAAERLLPVLMTALVTALGLIPLALGVGRAGNEIEAPLAIVVLGGLATSTVLCLIVLPAALTWSSGRLARWFTPAERLD
jgi:Cu/Ag efflux pump CusA